MSREEFLEIEAKFSEVEMFSERINKVAEIGRKLSEEDELDDFIMSSLFKTIMRLSTKIADVSSTF